MTEYGTELSLDVVVPFTLNDNGSTLLSSIGPVNSWEKWDITTLHTECNSTNDVILKVYRGSLGTPVAGSYSGNLDTNNTAITLMPGDTLIFSYTDGDAAAQGSITIRGTRWLKGRLAY